MKWTSVAWKAALCYGHWLEVAAPYFFAKIYVAIRRRDKEFPATIWEKILSCAGCFVVVGVIALYAGDGLGTHTEGEDPDDRVEVVDWVPTNSQIHEYELKIMMILFPAALLGLKAGYAEDKKLTPAERIELRLKIGSGNNSSDY